MRNRTRQLWNTALAAGLGVGAVIAQARSAGAQVPFDTPAVYAYDGQKLLFDVNLYESKPLAAKHASSASPFGVAQAFANLNSGRGFLVLASTLGAPYATSPVAEAVMDFQAYDPLGRDRVKVVIEFTAVASGGTVEHPEQYPGTGAIFRVAAGALGQLGYLRQDPDGLSLLHFPQVQFPEVLLVQGSHTNSYGINSNRIQVIGNGQEIEDTRGSGPLVLKKKFVLNTAPGTVQIINIHAEARVTGFTLVDPVVSADPENPEVTVTVRGGVDPDPLPLALPSAEDLTAAGIDVAPLEDLGLFNDAIFQDSFEKGDLSAWSASSSDGGNASVTSRSALVGQKGLAIKVKHHARPYVEDDTPNAEGHYRARFYIDPNSIKVARGKHLTIFTAQSLDTAGKPFELLLRRHERQYQVRLNAAQPGAANANSGWLPLPNQPSSVEIEWLRATGAGAQDGVARVWLGGKQAVEMTGLGNGGLAVDRVQLGLLRGGGSKTKGTLLLDHFESRRNSYIGQ